MYLRFDILTVDAVKSTETLYIGSRIITVICLHRDRTAYRILSIDDFFHNHYSIVSITVNHRDIESFYTLRSSVSDTIKHELTIISYAHIISI